VRRFFCDNTACAARTFVAQVDGLTVRYGRVTMLLRRVLSAIAVTVAARVGVRLAARLGISVGRDTLLRLVRALPDEPVVSLPRVGVDDFALRRGHVYGTVIVDMDSHRPVDVLPDRTRDTFAGWLRAHPGVELVCRDRAGAYAEAVRTAAPDALQVADRWHLWHNLIEAVEKTVIAERTALCAPDTDCAPASPQLQAAQAPDTNAVAAVADSGPAPAAVEARLATRTRQRWTAVQELVAAGRSISAIARELHLQRKTVRRFARAKTVEQLLDRPWMRRGSVLDPYKPYLHERFNDGCVDAVELTREITELGYRGSLKTVRTYLHPFRADRAAVGAALTLDHSSGAVEGNVTRIKAIKRQGYGRAGFDLLRKRILHRT
jgi:transposase